MSSALVRQALELVDEEECAKGKKSRKLLSKRNRDPQSAGQDHRHIYKRKVKKTEKKPKSKEELTEENVKKLLKLSESVAPTSVTEKIVERAVKGTALSDFIEVPQHKEDKPVLFDEETFRQFEQGYF